MDNPSPATLLCSTPPDESPIPSSSFKKAVSLTDWWLVKAEHDYNGMRLAIGGIEMKRQRATRVFHSSPIVKRHSTFILETADGATVIVWGIINKQRTHENGFPPEANERFLLGFPYNWEVYANLYCGERSGTQNATADSSFIAGLPVPSANCAPSARIPMRRLLEYLISTRSPDDTSKFANVDGNCASSQTLRNPTVLDSHMEAVYNGRNDVQAACNGRNDVQAACSPKEVNQLVAAYNGRNAVQSKKICVSKGSRSVLVRRFMTRSNCVENNNEGEQTPEEGVNNEKNEVGMVSKPEVDSFAPRIRKVGFISTEGNDAYIEHSEPVKSLISGEGHCNGVKKTLRQVNKSNESSPVLEEEKHTARVGWQNSGCRISKSRLKKSMKNLREDRVFKGNLEMEQQVSSSMLEKSDIVSDVRITIEHISHGIHLVAEDALEEVMCAETPKNNESTFIQYGFQVDKQSSHDIVCDKKESSISSIERGEAELGSNSNNSMTMRRSGDTVKGNIGRRKKSTLVNRHMLMRSSAKKLGVVLPESLNCKRSRSGRLLVPALASWRNEQPVYDLDGGIIGIAVGFNEKVPPTGGKYR